MKIKRLSLLLPLLFIGASSCHQTVEINFSLVYYASEGGKIIDPGNDIQVVYRGKDGEEVTAVPNEGFLFSSWSDGVLTATRQDKNIQANLAVTAFFVAKGNDGQNYL